jgi:hypothetical protein
MVSPQNPEGTGISLSYIDSALIFLDQETRFFKGIELEFTVPQSYLFYRGSLALVIYGELNRIPELGVADLQARQLSFEPIPNKILTVYQIPLRERHGLRTTPYVSVPVGVIPPSSFPLLFRVMPVIKGLNEDIEKMIFTLLVKPIVSDEGGVKIIPRFPENLRDRPFTVLIDDMELENPSELRLLKEGEHHLVILSQDYRNENRLFMIERGKILDISIDLQDSTPHIFFEAPENARIYFDNTLISPGTGPIPAEPGSHEVKFQLSDYTLIKNLMVQKGKTYRVAMSMDVQISEHD